MRRARLLETLAALLALLLEALAALLALLLEAPAARLDLCRERLFEARHLGCLGRRIGARGVALLGQAVGSLRLGASLVPRRRELAFELL